MSREMGERRGGERRGRKERGREEKGEGERREGERRKERREIATINRNERILFLDFSQLQEGTKELNKKVHSF